MFNRITYGKLIAFFVVFSVSACSTQIQESVAVSDWGLENELAKENDLFIEGQHMHKKWWHNFDDPVLNQLIEQGIENNMDVQLAVNNIAAVRARYGLVAWDAWPEGGLHVALEKYDSDFSAEKGERYSSGLGMTWELDLFARVKKKNKIARLQVHNSEEDMKAVQLLIIDEITSNYYLALAAEEKVRLRIQALENQKSVVDLTRSLVTENREAPDQLDRALAELYREEIALMQEQEQFLTLQNRLAVLLGEQAGHWQLPALRNTFEPLRIERVAIGDVSDLLRQRPDIRKAERTLTIGSLNKDLAHSEYFPHVSVTGFLGFTAGSVGQLGENGTDSWSVSPRLNWNFLDFGRVRKQVAIREAEESAAIIHYKHTVLRAIEEAENALSRYTTSHQTLSLHESRWRHSQTVADAEYFRYEVGTGSYLASLLAQREVLETSLERVEGIANHRIATAKIFKTLGYTGM